MLAIFIPPIATVERKLELVYLITASTHGSIDSLRVPQLHSSLILLRLSKERGARLHAVAAVVAFLRVKLCDPLQFSAMHLCAE